MGFQHFSVHLGFPLFSIKVMLGFFGMMENNRNYYLWYRVSGLGLFREIPILPLDGPLCQLAVTKVAVTKEPSV